MYNLLIFLLLPVLLPAELHNNTDINIVKSSSFTVLSKNDKQKMIEHIKNTGDCSYNGIDLFGKVKFVESFPDIKIKYVSSFPDMRVKFVSAFADECGEWQIVESFPDIKVKVVESFPDIKVKIVNSFPGIEK